MNDLPFQVPQAPEKLSLFDLLPRRETVTFSDGKTIEVTGLSAADLAEIMRKFPSLQKFFLGMPLTVGEIGEAAPGAVAYIIAAGCGHRGDEKAIAVASMLTAEQQSELLEGIGRATFTRGFGPFAQRAAAFGMQVSETGRAPATPSPRPSPRSSTPASPPTGPSPSPQDNSPPTPSSETVIASAA